MTTAAPTQTTSKDYAQLTALLREASTIGSIGGLLGWDQETYMPSGGARARAEQASVLARIHHDRLTDPRVGELLAACESDTALNAGGSETAANLREIRRDYDQATKVPGDLVAELARAGSEAQDIWKQARAKSDFAMFAPALTTMLELSRRKAECLGIPEGGELYDALLDQYEPDTKAAEIEAVFNPLRERLSAFIADVTENGVPPRDDFMSRNIPVGQQHTFGQAVLEALGFDFTAGRLDVTTHPFCSGMAPGDTRLTTRYAEDNFADALTSTMHEGGHGLYEQGLPKSGPHAGTPLAGSVSLGIHESQSRLWENFVGRSAPFWKWALPLANKHFGSTLSDVSLDQMTAAMNTCTPSLIRVESDEPTYNLHVMIRFGLERALVRGDLSIKDLPGAWNEQYKNLLGVDVPDDRRGCLQDVHWSFGLIGYFPTYSLGNLYAAQLWETINEQIPDLDDQMARGEFAQLLSWLRTNIHQHGRRYTAGELCERATGKPLSADPLMRHLERRVKPAYGM
ncbi:MAG: carboxypeptidase M32 [Phycisphaerales bacterium]|nr:carboxypeptidase M32 [Planctomycetota bacterium]MCH8508834.1 carboxypeptidase M32 [Phycisphaerales bacterium]